MPIRLSFPRRKSAGNIVEVLSDPPASESSFRVLDRDEVERQAASRDSRVRKKAPEHRNSSPIRYLHRPSSDHAHYLASRTNILNSTAVIATAASSSALSFQSTQPSSTDSGSNDGYSMSENKPPFMSQNRRNTQPSYLDEANNEQENPSKVSLAKKKFALARSKFERSENSNSERSHEFIRQDAGEKSQIGTSHASTHTGAAVPPRLDLGLGSNSPPKMGWFGQFGQSSPIMEEPTSFDTPGLPPPVFRSDSDSHIMAKKQFSFDSYDERRLPLSKDLDKAPSPELAPTKPLEHTNPLTDFQSRTSSSFKSDIHGVDLHGSPSLNYDESETLMGAAYASQALDRRYGTPSTEKLMDRPRGYNATSSSPYSPQMVGSPQPPTSQNRFMSSSENYNNTSKYGEESDSLFDTPVVSRNLRSVHSQSVVLPANTRVLTTAEFERAKKVMEDTRDYDEESEASEESDLYEDEDETERTRQIAKQRKKQEANLALYRQQMMKVTGEHPSDLPDRPADRPAFRRGTQSLPNITANATTTSGVDPNGKNGDDSDDEVPLGVLQAHGFPNKSRPPNRTANSARPATQMSSYPAPPGATKNDINAGGGGSGNLPPFARNLPADPYLGASLVNQSNREALSYNTPSRSATPSPSSSLPPGGLVGVIVGEERARAMRRGSPNTDGVYGPTAPQQQQQLNPQQHYLQMLQQQQQQQQHQLHVQQQPTTGMALSPEQQAHLTPAEQAQIQMNNSMTQMMQTQMQWMQQMIQMQTLAQQSGTPMPPMPQMPQMPISQQQGGLRGAHQRAYSGMSTHTLGSRAPSAFGVKPATSVDGIQARYAQSLAPSERSNVGQPSRYRPVTPSNVTSASHSTGPTGSSQTGSGQLYNPRSRSPLKQYEGGTGFDSTIRAVSRPKKGAGGGAGDVSDDEDDAGWAEMRKKREQRKSKWKPRRDTASEAQSQASSGLEGLYYEGPESWE